MSWQGAVDSTAFSGPDRLALVTAKYVKWLCGLIVILMVYKVTLGT